MKDGSDSTKGVRALFLASASQTNFLLKIKLSNRRPVSLLKVSIVAFLGLN